MTKIYLPELLKLSFGDVYKKNIKWYYTKGWPEQLKTFGRDLKQGKINILALSRGVVVPIFAPLLLVFAAILERKYYRKVAAANPDRIDSIHLEEKE